MQTIGSGDRPQFTDVAPRICKVQGIIAFNHFVKYYIDNKLNYEFLSFIMDARKGAVQLLENKYNKQIPIQLCNFYQIKSIIIYIIKKPKTDCGKDIKELLLLSTKTIENDFINKLNTLLNKYKDFLKEKSGIKLIINK